MDARESRASTYFGDHSFPTTHWSLVGRAGAGDVLGRRKALENLLTHYLPALTDHLVRYCRIDRDGADDLIQGFISCKIIERDLFASADSNQGRLRTLLLTALDRYLISVTRQEQADKRAPDRAMSLDRVGATTQAVSVGPSEAFDAAWARRLLDRTLALMQEECVRLGRQDLWDLFHCRVVAPTLEGAEQTPYRALVSRFGFASPAQASNALVTAKRLFTRTLRSVIAEYTHDPREIEAEVQDLTRALSGHKK